MLARVQEPRERLASCARRRPGSSLKDAGSIPATSTIAPPPPWRPYSLTTDNCDGEKAAAVFRCLVESAEVGEDAFEGGGMDRDIAREWVVDLYCYKQQDPDERSQASGHERM